MTYRIYFGGGDCAWIIQAAAGQEFVTVQVAESVQLHVPSGMPPYVPGPKPNGFVLVEGRLWMDGKIAHIEPG